MLYEIRRVRQNPGEPFRRWFTDDRFDLYVWYDSPTLERLVGFQLCYDKDKHHTERALTWYRGRGFDHRRVDEGDVEPTRNQSAILLSDGRFPKEAILLSFREAARELDPDLVTFIARTLEGYGE